jgi:protein-tyrosine-phosphatase
MAEALARQLLPDTVMVGSAGLQPLGYVAEETLLVLAEAGIPTEGLWSKGLTEVYLAAYPLLVNLTSYNTAVYLPRTFQGRIVRHPVTDPFGSPLPVYREVRESLRRFISEDLPARFPHF